MSLTKKNIVNIGVVALFLVILLVPSAKALVLRGLLEIGLFKPALSSAKTKPDFDLSTIRFKNAKNQSISLADLNGKIVFLNFWATWCPPCLAEMPSINKLHQQYVNDNNVVFLLVDADGTFAKSQAYMDRKGYKMPVYTFDSDVPKQLFSGSLPTTLVFDKKGRISYQGVGAADYASPKFIAFMNALKAQKE